jgi:hypothetical protein
MKLITRLCAISTFSLLCTFFAFAQTPDMQLGIRPQPGSELFGSVEISSSTLAFSNNIVSGTFAATSLVGNADTVYYGLALKGGSGELVDISPILGQFTLIEDVPQTANLSYTLPTIYASTTEVYLNLSNQSGVKLAELLIGNAPQGTYTPLCTIKDTEADCTAPITSDLSISVYDNGPQGALVGTTSMQLVAKQMIKIPFEDLLQNFGGGHYVISITIASSGSIMDSFVKEYSKAGPITKIMGTSLTRNADAWTLTTYTNTEGAGGDSTLSLSFAPSCGAPVEMPLTGNATTATLSLPCTSGYVAVAILENGTSVDSVNQSFFIPPVPQDMNRILIGLVSLIVIALSFVFYIMHKHHHALVPHEMDTMSSMQSPTGPVPVETMPQSLATPPPMQPAV